MASISEEENISEEGGRRTRSGRKVTSTPITPRSTRRSTRKQAQEQIIEQTEITYEEECNPQGVNFDQSDIIKEMLAEAAQGVLVSQNNTEDDDEQNVEYTEIADASEIHDDIIETIEEEIVTSGNDMDMVIQYSDEQIIPVEAEDEKSSSFPFGSMQQSENSDGKTEDNIVTNMSECVDSSLLASLVGDNANSLPSVGEESLSKENFETVAIENESDKKIDLPMYGITIESPESKSEHAIAEDLPNGEALSQKTIVDIEMVSEDEFSTSNKQKVFDADNSEDESSNLHESNKVTDAEVVSDEEVVVSRKRVIETEAEALSDGDFSIPVKSEVNNAEIVFEDELPTSVKEKVTDAEEVSDEELPPAPTRAELPADTEVVSEDELPSVKKKTTIKRKSTQEEYNPSSPTDDADVPEEKKVKLAEDLENKEKKKLPELEKYWKTVKDEPADFTGWTYLLQYVDQENDIEAAREAYDAFLSHYPYCYGYWRKYADYEKRKGNKNFCEEVFERGLKAIPLSVDLWIHYLTHVKQNYVDNEEYIRTQFERAIDACGLEFRSDKLWEAFIKWELEGKRYFQVAKIYDRLLATPTQGYNAHFDSYQDLVNNHSPSSLLTVEEFKKFRSEVRELNKITLIKESEDTKDKESNDELMEEKKGDQTELTDINKEQQQQQKKHLDEETEADDHIHNEEELAAIRDRIIASRRKIHKSTITAVTSRWTFEEGVKRPYFHVKPLERCQLKNWKEYLDFEIEKGDRKRILILFERCLIACALYDEFWLKLVRYLESQNDPDLIPILRDAFERGCLIHHTDKPSLHLMWSAFEECQNNFDKAAEILKNIEVTCPNLLQIAYRRINLERRRGDYDKCKELYEYYISTAKNKNISGSLAIKYARFLHKICGKIDDGFKVLSQILEKDPGNTRIALQMIDLALQRDKVNENEIVEIMDKFMSRENMDPEQKVLFAQRKVEFLEDFGSTAKGLQDAQRALQVALSKLNETKKNESSPTRNTSPTPTKEIPTNTPITTVGGGAGITGQPQTTTAYNSNYGGYGSNATNSQYYGGNQSYQSYDGYGYNHWQQSSYGYSGYGQWSGYGNYY